MLTDTGCGRPQIVPKPARRNPLQEGRWQDQDWALARDICTIFWANLALCPVPSPGDGQSGSWQRTVQNCFIRTLQMIPLNLTKVRLASLFSKEIHRKPANFPFYGSLIGVTMLPPPPLLREPPAPA